MNAENQELDDEAMRRLKRGEEVALNEIMIRWEKLLRAYLFRELGSWVNANEVAQDVFVRIWQARQQYRPEGKFRSWIFRIANNLVRNLKRWQARHPVTLWDDSAEKEAGGGSPSWQGREEQFDQVEQVVRALPDDLRTAILMAEYEGLSLKEIGEVCGCSAKAVEGRLYRARAILTKSLKTKITFRGF